MTLKWRKSYGNLTKILRNSYENRTKIVRKSYENHEAQFPKLLVFVGQKSIFRQYCIQNVKDGIQIRVYRINKETLTHFSQFISGKGKKKLRKSQALRK